MTTIQVSNTTELVDALINATGGETIELATGDYGDFVFNARDLGVEGQITSEVTIKSADTTNPAEFNSMHLRFANDISIDGVLVDQDIPAGQGLTRAVYIQQSSDITFKNSHMDGDIARDLYELWDGYPIGSAIYAFDVEGLMVENNTITNFSDGVFTLDSDQVDILNNDIYGLSNDGIKIAATRDANIIGNHVHDFEPNPNTNSHLDFIQIFSNGASNYEATRDVIIRDNILNSGDGATAQAMFIRNELVDSQGFGPEYIYQNLTIENNVIHNSHQYGVQVNGTNNLVVRNNTLLKNEHEYFQDFVPTTPRILIREDVTNALIEDNIMPIESVVYNTSHVYNNNIVIQRDFPDAENYVGDLFVNGLANGDATIADLQVIPGALPDGVGASLTAFDTMPELLTGYASDDIGNGFYSQQVEFTTEAVYGPNGLVDLTGATVEWDFGDGTQGTGLNTTHFYETHGFYTAHGTITLASGDTLEIARSVNVESPVLAWLTGSGDDGFDDVSGRDQLTFAQDGVTIETGPYGNAINLNGNNLFVNRSADFEIHQDMTYGIDFQKGVDNPGGVLMLQNNGFALEVTDDTLSLRAFSDQGTHNLSYTTDTLNNGGWHSAAFTHSGTTGEIHLYLNGELVDSITDLQGADFANPRYHLYVGDPFGSKPFDGLVDNVIVTSGALPQEHIESLRDFDLATIIGENPTPVDTNEAPLAVSDSATLNENESVTVNVLSNDSDPDNDTLNVTNVTAASNGTVVNNGDGTVTYTPDADFNGTDSLSYTITDGELTDTATLNLTVEAVNDAPVAADDAATLSEDGSITVDLLSNDTDVDGDNLSIESLTNPAHGTLVDNGDGTVTYTPDADYNGMDTLTYTVTDGELTDTATLNLTVEAVNDAPNSSVLMSLSVKDGALVDSADAYDSPHTYNSNLVTSDGYTLSPGSFHDYVHINRSTAPQIFNQDEMTISIGLKRDDATDSGGSFVGLYNAYNIRILPNGELQLDYITADGNRVFINSGDAKITDEEWHHVSVTLDGVNGVATLYIDGAEVGSDAITDGTKPVESWNLLIGDQLGGAINGTVDSFVMTADVADPAAIAETADLFIGFKNAGGEVSQQVILDAITSNDSTPDVLPNVAPVATDDAATLSEDGSITVDLLANDTDSDGDSLSIESLTNPVHGTLVDNGDGTVTYTPDANFNGADALTYTVTDGDLTDTATLSLTVEAVNDAPTLLAPAPTTISELAEAGTVVSQASASDIDGDVLSYSLLDTNTPFTIDADSGLITVAQSDSLDFETQANYNLAIQVTDSQGATAQQTLEVALLDEPEVDLSALLDDSALAFYLEDAQSVSTLPDSSAINLASSYDAKHLTVSFQTGIDVSSRQVIYEQGGGVRGLNIFVEGGTLYYAAWNNRESNWGYKEIGVNIEGGQNYVATLVLDGNDTSTGTLTAYLNGAQVGQEDGVGLLYRHSGDVGIGEMDNDTVFFDTGASGNGYTFSGTLDQVIQFNRVLSNQEQVAVEAHVSANPIPEVDYGLIEEYADVMAFELRDPATRTLANGDGINLGGPFSEKTLSMNFTTSEDVETTQVLFEQGAGTRGINAFIEGGKIFMAIWNHAEQRWGYHEMESDITADTEYVATLVFDGTASADGTLSFYLNGELAGSADGIGLLYAHSGTIGVGEVSGTTLLHDASTNSAHVFGGELHQINQFNLAFEGEQLDALHDYVDANDSLFQLSDTGSLTIV